ncbi:hypothetical protein RUM44_001211 [Polyplax serrata]|uniref:G-protein coupled receptors family 1 profile domain-containing protein n=1 Tax=Polyplax serrata TaxID=468196 RepID=A0ABR1B9T2_POLSC
MSGWNNSYIFGNDEVSGWGPRYFYTFYSEFGQRRGASQAEVAALSLTFFLSVALNVTIACAVLRYREMRTVTNCFFLNLAAADLVFALGIPVVAVTRITQNWILGNATCRMLAYSQFVCGFVLLWTLTLISIDRHRCIVIPPYRSQLTPKLAAALSLGTWLLAAVLFLPVAFWFREENMDGKVIICTLVFPRSDKINASLCFTIPVVLFTCLLPMTLLVFHYQRIFQKLTKTRNRWSNNGQLTISNAPDLNSSSSRRQSSLSIIGSLASPLSRKTSSGSQTVLNSPVKIKTGTLSHHEELRLAKHVRVVRILLLNVVAVLIMWLPITIIMFLIYVDGSRPNEDTNFFLRSHHFIWSLLIALLNTIVNPLLYGVLSENFRSYFAKLWLGSRRGKNCNDFSERSLTANANKSKSYRERYNENLSSENRSPSTGRWNEAYTASQIKGNVASHPI